jgi:hypothetical protein
VQAILAHLVRSYAAAPPGPTRARRPHVARASAPLATRPLTLVGTP